jgi:hypothetical protein
MRERHWVALVSPECFADERLYAHESITLPAAPRAPLPEAGQPVALLVDTDPPQLFALGRVTASGDRDSAPGDVTVEYTHRLFDDPTPVDEPSLALDHSALHRGVSPVAADAFERLAGLVAADRRVDADKAGWLVSLALPIEAASPAEAVREFWTYVTRLGPRELPAFVWPTGDELAMQAYVLGEPTNLDPEEDD